MSLLIKALDSLDKNKQAEQSKKQAGGYDAALDSAPADAKPELSLSTDGLVENSLTLEEEAGLSDSPAIVHKYAKPEQAVDKFGDKAKVSSTVQSDGLKSKPQGAAQAAKSKQKDAAKVFVANQRVKTTSSKYALLLLGVVGALIIWLGFQGYTYVRNLSMPAAVAIKSQTAVEATGKAGAVAADELAVLPEGAEVAATKTTNAAVINGNQDKSTGNQLPREQSPAVNNIADDQTESEVTVKPDANEFAAESGMPKKPRTKKVINSNKDASPADSETLLQHTPVRLTSRAPSAVVEPALLAAYQAFSRGEDAAAQQQYRQVLQRDVRNVDALLGMAAIAQRQGRDADAAGWYQKVLELEPRNTIAQSAIISSPQVNADTISIESRIKSMLAQQPEAANLHMALGNLYAGQNQWIPAQEAYFNASHLVPNSADYAFNLAVSLDQLGKPNLALMQYQRALDLLNKSGASSPDRTQLEARIKALQSLK